MGDIYVRQSSFADGDTITSSLFNNEFDQLVLAFAASTGHTHDGTTAEGGPITIVGPSQDLTFTSSALLPTTTNSLTLGSATKQFKDAYFDGTVNLDGLVIGSATSITDVDTDLTSVSATDNTVASAKAIKTYVDAQVTAQDLDFQGDTGGALSIDLDSETLTIAGGTGLDTVGSGNTVTVNIDSTVATLTGTQTLTNKTINVDNNTVSNIEVDNFKASAVVTEAEGISSNDNDTTLPTSAAVKDYVDTKVTGEDLDITTDSGTIAIDLDSETLTVAGGTGLDSSATGNTVTLAIDSTVTTNSGTQTLTNKTINAGSNTISNITVSMLGSSAVVTEAEGISSNDNDTTLPTSAAVKDYVDASVATKDQITELTDVTITSVADNEVLAYDSTSSKWINQTAAQASLATAAQGTKADSALQNIVEDTTPQLGGQLDANGNNIDMGTNTITDTKVGQWDTAYGWGNYASAIGVTVQAYDADTAKYDDTTANFTGTLQQGGVNVATQTYASDEALALSIALG